MKALAVRARSQWTAVRITESPQDVRSMSVVYETMQKVVHDTCGGLLAGIGMIEYSQRAPALED